MGNGDWVQGDREDASKRAAGRLLTKLGTRLEQLDTFIQEVPDDDTHVTEVRFSVRYGTVGDILGVIKANTAKGKQIAFHSGDTVSEVLVGLVNRLNNGTLVWKEDKPYEEG